MLALLQPCYSSAQVKGNLWTASDGKGTISLFWAPAKNAWPKGGWRLERIARGKTAIVANGIGPAFDEAALSRVKPKEASGIKDFAAKIKKGSLSAEELNTATVILGLNAIIDPVYGHALGLRYTDSKVEQGEIFYRLVALDASGKPGAVLQSRKIDSHRATPLPESLADLKADISAEGILLSWVDPKENSVNPTVAYMIEREDSKSGVSLLTQKPMFVSSKTDGSRAINHTFLEEKPPVEIELTYRAYTVDIFGRKSAPAMIKVFSPDFSGMIPPKLTNIKAGEGYILISWESNKNPYRASYVIERSYLYEGPYEVVTPKGLAANINEFKDDDVRGGTQYYYRVRSVGLRGSMGHASQTVSEQAINKGKVPQPEGLKASVGHSRVRLTWKAVSFPVAGYFVERRSEGKNKWARMNERVTPEPLYDDFFGKQNGQKFSYRIVAVGFDNKESSPSKSVEVLQPDTLPPAAPYITNVSGRGGKAALKFSPALPEEDTAQFLLLRGGSINDPGLVIGDPLAGDLRKVEDAFVEPGKEYWYRMVAIDKSGNRSEPSRPMAVRIGSPDIPKPVRPDAKLMSSPFPHMVISFEAPLQGLVAFVLFSREDGVWKKLAGPLSASTQVVDADLPSKGKVQYRVVYRSSNGVEGEPSDTIEILLP